MLYTRERLYYAEQITLGIEELYEAKNGKISDGLLFSWFLSIYMSIHRFFIQNGYIDKDGEHCENNFDIGLEG